MISPAVVSLIHNVIVDDPNRDEIPNRRPVARLTFEETARNFTLKGFDLLAGGLAKRPPPDPIPRAFATLNGSNPFPNSKPNSKPISQFRALYEAFPNIANRLNSDTVASLSPPTDMLAMATGYHLNLRASSQLARLASQLARLASQLARLASQLARLALVLLVLNFAYFVYFAVVTPLFR